MAESVSMDYMEITTDERHPLHVPYTADLPNARRSIYVGPFIGTKTQRLEQQHAIMRYNVEHREAQRAHGLRLVYWPSLNQAQMYRGRGSVYTIMRPADFAPYAYDIAAIDALLAATPDPARQDWYDEWPRAMRGRRAQQLAQLSMFEDDDADDVEYDDEVICDD